MLYDCFAVPVQLFKGNNRNHTAAIRARDMVFSYFWLNSVNCLPLPSGHTNAVSLKLVLAFAGNWVNGAPIFHCFPSMWRLILSWICRLLFNDRNPISGNTSERHPDRPVYTSHFANDFQGLKCQTTLKKLQTTSVNDLCLHATWCSSGTR